MNFVKMHGNGNDFIMIEDLKNQYVGQESKIAKILCDRKRAIGGDGIILIRNSTISDIQMIIINADGSYASMCGNGLRCFVKYVYDNGIIKDHVVNIETGDGVKKVKINLINKTVNTIEVNMGKGSFNPKDIPSTEGSPIINKKIKENNKEYSIVSLRMGVPHTVIFGCLKDFSVDEGKAIEKNKLFLQGTNVNFCEIVNREHIKVKTWERGAGATLACGTGCCASVLAAYKVGLVDDDVVVDTDGGNLKVKIMNDYVYMIGTAVEVFKGTTNIYEE